MIPSNIDRETYKRNKVKELMSLGTESDNEWFEENNLILSNDTETKTETETNTISNENNNEIQTELSIDNFDFNDTLSARLDAFQEKINAMLAEGNKMLNQTVTRKNVDLPYYSSETKRRHRHHSQGKPKVAFSSDTKDSDDDSNAQQESSSSSPKTKLTNKSKKSTTDSNRKLDGKNMLQNAISFSKLILNNDKNNSMELKNKRSVSPNPSTLEEKKDTTNSNSSPKLIGSKSESFKKDDTIDSLLTQSLKDGESILQTNEMELLRIELKELKEKNKQLQQENMNLKIKNSSFTERQKQQEQQIEKLKQKNSQLQRLLSETNYSSSNPSSPSIEGGLNSGTDSDRTNSATSSPSQMNIHKSNKSSRITHPVIGHEEVEDKPIHRNIKTIKDMEQRRFSFPQKLYPKDPNENEESSFNTAALHQRTRSNGNTSLYHSLPKNKSLLFSNQSKY